MKKEKIEYRQVKERGKKAHHLCDIPQKFVLLNLKSKTEMFL